MKKRIMWSFSIILLQDIVESRSNVGRVCEIGSCKQSHSMSYKRFVLEEGDDCSISRSKVVSDWKFGSICLWCATKLVLMISWWIPYLNAKFITIIAAWTWTVVVTGTALVETPVYQVYAVGDANIVCGQNLSQEAQNAELKTCLMRPFLGKLYACMTVQLSLALHKKQVDCQHILLVYLCQSCSLLACRITVTS